MTDVTKFDIERMIESFENIYPSDMNIGSSSDNEELWLPGTESFLRAMKEMSKLFEIFGGAFIFVRRDIMEKIDALEGLLKEQPTKYTLLKCGLDWEIEQGIVWNKNVVSGTRHLYRLMWAIKFLLALIIQLELAFSKKEGKVITLRICASNAYQIALAEHHSWSIRKTVAAALYFLPSKESFLEKMGVVETKRYEYLRRLQNCLTPVIDEMYRYYEKYCLLDIP